MKFLLKKFSSNYKAVIALFFIVSIVSCVAKKAVNDYTLLDQSYKNGDYKLVIKSCNEEIEAKTLKNKSVDPKIYAYSGKSYFMTGEKEKAMEYFKKAEDLKYIESDILIMKIKYYRDIDNLSKELTCLETFANLYSDNVEMNFVNERFFIRYLEMNEFIMADSVKQLLSVDVLDRIDILEKSFELCKKLNKDEELSILANKIIKIDPENIIAFEFISLEHFRKTEASYQAEIDKYERKKTTGTYTIMMNNLKPVTEQFKISRDNFLKLYNKDPKPYYAKYLATIYARLNDSKKSKYYQNLSD